ncbi:MAG: diaminopimelate epimerase [Pelagibacterales bacterium]|nr:diaminopimelate epimerase [Pelagibacterales bacterium]
MRVPFVKMNGLGNDFIIFDARHQKIELSTSEIKRLSNRKNIGCDQLVVLEESNKADCLMVIYNSDGSLSGACGNATRCVASILFTENNSNEAKIETEAGILNCLQTQDNLISVHMGIPKFEWQEIPLQEKNNSQEIHLHGFKFCCVNVGNPHAVTFVEKAISDKEFFEIGPKVETDKIFPKKTNVEFAQILSDNLIEVRVWERGAGETLACGSGACAVGILAIKHKLINSNKITVRFKGGDLIIEWNGKNSSVIMTGGFEKIFDGLIEIN